MLVSRKQKPEDTIVDVKGESWRWDSSFCIRPCSVESYEQVAAVAHAIKAKGFKVIRGGAYKPRTSPYDFQGLGLEGLKNFETCC